MWYMGRRWRGGEGGGEGGKGVESGRRVVEEVPYPRSSICLGQILNLTFLQSASQYNCVFNLLSDRHLGPSMLSGILHTPPTFMIYVCEDLVQELLDSNYKLIHNIYLHINHTLITISVREEDKQSHNVL